MISNTFVGLVNLLKADAEIVALVGTRVFGYRLPASEAGSLPRKTIVIRPAGGPGARGFVKHRFIRVDVFCYGETEFEADELCREVHDTLKQLPRTKAASALINNVDNEAGPIYMVDPDTDWPVVWESWLVATAEAPSS